jgi:hypothetical protein
MRALSWRWAVVDGIVALAVGIMVYLTVWVWHSGMQDIGEYAHYAQAFWAQSPRLQQFPLEYPPLALLPFTLTLIPASDPAIPFAIGMGVIILAMYAGFIHWAGRRPALIFMLYLLLSEQALMTARFDIFPALLAVGALWAAERHHFAWAQALLALGTLVKIYPLFFVPLVMLAEIRFCAQDGPMARRDWRALVVRLSRSVGGGVGIVMAGLLVVQWRSPGAALAPISYAAQRPVQVESAPATISWLGSLLGAPVAQVYTYHSVNWVGSLPNALLPLTLPALVVGCGLVYLWYARGNLTLAGAFLATLGVVLLTNRVFSTQYLIWIVPFAALVEGLDAAWIVLCLLQAADDALYPYDYSFYTPTNVFWFLVVAACRNALLLYVTARLFWRKQPQEAPEWFTWSPWAKSSSISLPPRAM